MKILELRAENIKRLKVVTIKPNGNLVEITGKNGQGKTSVLDAIWWALEGQKNIQAVPIRKGATSAKIRLDLGELRVTRAFSQEKDAKTKEPTGGFTTSIIVENQDGARFPSPQSVIDGLLGALSFDPLAFTRMKPTEQLETLKRFVPGVDFAAIDGANKADFDKRTALNRTAKELRAQESGIVVREDAPKKEIDESALVEQLNEAGKHNTDLETRKQRRQAALDAVAQKRDLARDLIRQAKELREKADGLDQKAASVNEDAAALDKKLTEAPPLPQPIDTSSIAAEITAARNSNRAFASNEQAKAEKTRLAERATETEKQADDLTEAIELRKKQKADAIASAKMPIEGLGFGDGTVLMGGIPFEQASDAERLRASIGIAAAMNPKLRVIRVRDGSLLDSDAMNLLADFADANDLQVWIERVDQSGKVGFVLEDGELKGQEVPDGVAS